MNDGLFKNALELYSKAIKIAPKNAVYYCNRAAAYSKLEDHKSAIDDCNLALRIDPNYSKAYGRLGLAYYGLGNYEKSVEYYRKAIQLVPDNEAFKNNYELALTKINKQKNEASTSTRNLNTILNNPEMMNIATQMFSNPAMQSTMLNVFSRRFNTNRTNDMDDIQNIGQSIAQDIYAENPQSMADLIDSVSRSPLQTLINQGEATQAPNTTTDNNAEVSTLIDTETQQSNENNDENKE
ncbi:hypothetical protein O3M35_007798 [Rhynocoris fuscipes]|uniref:Small glutamine-rich tetratricopeptide repeat-containing protein alpha n=1 Tax=Rhynocoris fuscipes TaxID=488301 RepID=A0AAW1DBA1_9HEMI